MATCFSNDLQYFKDNYLLKNGDIPDEIALALAPVQLKTDVIEIYENINILTGGIPNAWVSGYNYRICEYVSYNGLNYKAIIAHTSATGVNEPFPTDTVNWQLVDVTAAGSGNSESTIYKMLLDNSGYSDCYYDLLDVSDNIITTGIHSKITTNVTGVAGNTITTTDILAGATPVTGGWYDFSLFFINPEANITVEYSSDNAVFTAVPADNRIYLPNGVTGITSLYIRFTFTGSGTLESFGILYNNTGLVYYTNTKLYENVTLTSAVASGSSFTIPNNKTFVPDGKSLSIYLNGKRLLYNVDYTETNRNTILLNISLVIGDVLIFEEQYGYVDLSRDNSTRLDLEHDINGNHIFTDTVTGTNYKLDVTNGAIALTAI